MDSAKWYVAVDGETIGPLSTREVLDRIRVAGDPPPPVWAEGMEAWADASSIPELCEASVSEPRPADPPLAEPLAAETTSPAKPGIGARLRHELIEFAIIACYLYIAFGVLIAFKFTILKGQGVAWAPWGIALVKALILGKFILLLQAMKLGEGGDVVVWRIVRKTGLFVMALFALNGLEEFLIGRLHGKTNAEIAEDMAGLLSGPFVISVLMFLILAPYFAFRELDERLGEGSLRRLLTSRRSAGESNDMPGARGARVRSIETRDVR